MTPEIYTALKTRLEALTDSNSKPLYKTVMLWNGQIDHLLQEGNDNYPVNFPACFIEFYNINCTNLQNKATVQQCNFETKLRIVHKLIKNEDIAILTTKLKTYQMMQIAEFTSSEPTVSRFTRISETPNYDNNLLMVFEQDYHATYKDFSAVPTPTTGSATLTLNRNIVTSI